MFCMIVPHSHRVCSAWFRVCMRCDTFTLEACPPHFPCFIHPSVACAPRDPRSQTRPWSLHYLIPYIPPWLACPYIPYVPPGLTAITYIPLGLTAHTYIPPGLTASEIQRNKSIPDWSQQDWHRVQSKFRVHPITRLARLIHTWLARHHIHPSVACAPRDPRSQTRPWSLHYLRPHHSEIQRNESIPDMISLFRLPVPHTHTHTHTTRCFTQSIHHQYHHIFSWISSLSVSYSLSVPSRKLQVEFILLTLFETSMALPVLH